MSAVFASKHYLQPQTTASFLQKRIRAQNPSQLFLLLAGAGPVRSLCSGGQGISGAVSPPRLENVRRVVRRRAGGSAGDVGQQAMEATDIVLGFYEAINRRDLDGALLYIAVECIYEDMIYQSPFSGKKEIQGHFQRIFDQLPPGFRFVVDDITTGDSSAVGLTWHVELNGRPFPFSRGCSFYRCQLSQEGAREIVYARDIPEPATKPGNAALVLLKLLSFVFTLTSGK